MVITRIKSCASKQWLKMAGKSVVCIFALYVVGIQCGGSTSSFRKQAEFVKDISAKGREVELKFNADPCLRGVLVGIQRCCTEGKRVQGTLEVLCYIFCVD